MACTFDIVRLMALHHKRRFIHPRVNRNLKRNCEGVASIRGRLQEHVGLVGLLQYSNHKMSFEVIRYAGFGQQRGLKALLTYKRSVLIDRLGRAGRARIHFLACPSCHPP